MRRISLCAAFVFMLLVWGKNVLSLSNVKPRMVGILLGVCDCPFKMTVGCKLDSSVQG